jgi:hypothetical protein
LSTGSGAAKTTGSGRENTSGLGGGGGGGGNGSSYAAAVTNSSSNLLHQSREGNEIVTETQLDKIIGFSWLHYLKVGCRRVVNAN